MTGHPLQPGGDEIRLPGLGKDVTNKALGALYYATLLIAVYISGRFEQRWMAGVAMAAVLWGGMYLAGLTGLSMGWLVLVALGGCVVCHEQRSFSSTMGTGQMVFGLAAVIIGTTIFKKFPGVKGTTAVLVGSVVYKCCIQLAISLGLPANLLKLITAVLFLVILVIGNVGEGKVKRSA